MGGVAQLVSLGHDGVFFFFFLLSLLGNGGGFVVGVP